MVPRSLMCPRSQTCCLFSLVPFLVSWGSCHCVLFRRVSRPRSHCLRDDYPSGASQPTYSLTKDEQEANQIKNACDIVQSSPRCNAPIDYTWGRRLAMLFLKPALRLADGGPCDMARTPAPNTYDQAAIKTGTLDVPCRGRNPRRVFPF